MALSYRSTTGPWITSRSRPHTFVNTSLKSSSRNDESDQWLVSRVLIGLQPTTIESINLCLLLLKSLKAPRIHTINQVRADGFFCNEHVSHSSPPRTDLTALQETHNRLDLVLRSRSCLLFVFSS